MPDYTDELRQIVLALRNQSAVDLTQLVADIQALETSQSAQDTSIAGNTQQILNLHQEQDTQDTSISANTAGLSGHDTRIAALEAASGGGGIEGYIWAGYYVASDVGGGAFMADAWRQRQLNTLETNIAGVSLAANTVSGIPAGNYLLSAKAAAYKVYRHQVRMNIAGMELLGDTPCVDKLSASGSSSVIAGRVISVTTTTAATLWHRCQENNFNSVGMGIEGYFGPTTHAEILLLKTG